MRHLSIRWTGPILLLIPVLIAVVSLALLATWQGRRIADRFAGRLMDQAASRVETQVENYLANSVHVTDHVAAAIAAGELDPLDLPAWRPRLLRELTGNQQINSVTFGNRQGGATWMIRYPGEQKLEYALLATGDNREIVEYEVESGGSLGETIGSYDFDPRTRPWYEAAESAGQPTWTPPYAWVGSRGRSTTLGIAYARPIFDDAGELIGVLDSDISLADVSRFLSAARAFDSSHAMLVDAGGELIATSSGTSVVDAEGNRISAVDADEQLIADVAKRVGSFSTIRDSQTHSITSSGKDYRVDTRPFANPWGLDWRLAVIVPDSEIMAGVDRMRRQAWAIGGIVILLTLGLGLLAAYGLVRPVSQLAAAVRKMAGGNLDDRVRVGGNREFVELSDELNRMSVALKDRLRLRQSLALAMEIQQRLLPEETPSLPGLEVAGHSTFCDETGGDYFDFIELSPTDADELLVVVGDVMGHGIAAALLMATARGILRSRAGDEDSLGHWLTHVNRLLVEDTGGERFMTMSLLVCDPKRRRLRLASAGHDIPIVYEPADDRFLDLPDVSGLPLGIVADEEYHEAHPATVGDGAILLVGTDGLWESENDAGEAFGKDRVREILRTQAAATATAISAAVAAGLSQFRGQARQDDDITFVVVKFSSDGISHDAESAAHEESRTGA